MRPPPDQRNAALCDRGGVIIRNSTFSEGTVTTSYYTPAISATEFAACLFSRRYRLAPHTARLVCHLAGIGGAV